MEDDKPRCVWALLIPNLTTITRSFEGHRHAQTIDGRVDTSRLVFPIQLSLTDFRRDSQGVFPVPPVSPQSRTPMPTTDLNSSSEVFSLHTFSSNFKVSPNGNSHGAQHVHTTLLARSTERSQLLSVTMNLCVCVSMLTFCCSGISKHVHLSMESMPARVFLSTSTSVTVLSDIFGLQRPSDGNLRKRAL